MAKETATKKSKETKSQTKQFEADVGRLLDIVANALYSNRDVFLRELISNAADACDRLRYETVKNPDLLDTTPDYNIRITTDKDKNTLTIADNGIGMSHDELVENLGTIAKSGTRALMEQLKSQNSDKDSLNLIGQFGVGFYASFMVADKVTVTSRKAGEKDAWIWESDGRTGYTLSKASDTSSQFTNGTVITCHLKEDAREYNEHAKLQNIITQWSDHIDLPVYLGEERDDETPANTAKALWTRTKSDISDEDYAHFYQQVSNGLSMDTPALTLHWRAEGIIEYTGLLFVPSARPWDLYDPSRKNALKLYVKRVFITDQCENLVFPWLRFLRGVIDTQDLSLNISREMLQTNPVVTKIRNGIATKTLKELQTLAEKDNDKYMAFWNEFGPVLKEGLYDARDYTQDLLKLCYFYSTHDTEKQTTLADYVSRMKEGQKKIYFISGENLQTLRNSPQIEGLVSRGIEVLLFKDTIDDFWIPTVQQYEGFEFTSVTKGQIDLSEIEGDETKTDKNAKAKDKKKEADTSSLDPLLAQLKTILKEDVEDVRLSSRLTDSPVCLVASDTGVDIHMERVLKIHQHYTPESKRVLEINPDHTLVKALSGQSDNKTIINDAAYLLLDQARIALGEQVPDPNAFARRLTTFMSKGLAA